MKKLLLILTLLQLFCIVQSQEIIQLPAFKEGSSNNYIMKGTGDGGNLHTYNTFFRYHFGFAIGSPYTSKSGNGYEEKATVAFNARNGDISTLGKLSLEGTGTGIIKIGHSIRAVDRAELHLHANGVNSVSEIFFGSDARNDANVRWTLSDRGKSDGRFILYEGPANCSSWKERLVINKGGNVGIGTTNPKYLLSVKGKIGAGEIVVEDITTWADFVFNSDYRLMPLAEVESFIQENNHLPDVPSETEVKEKGINVAEMNAKLLQKIEELTLYVIEQQKQTIKVMEDNKELRKEIEILKNK